MGCGAEPRYLAASLGNCALTILSTSAFGCLGICCLWLRCWPLNIWIILSNKVIEKWKVKCINVWDGSPGKVQSQHWLALRFARWLSKGKWTPAKGWHHGNNFILWRHNCIWEILRLQIIAARSQFATEPTSAINPVFNFILDFFVINKLNITLIPLFVHDMARKKWLRRYNATRKIETIATRILVIWRVSTNYTNQRYVYSYRQSFSATYIDH